METRQISPLYTLVQIINVAGAYLLGTMTKDEINSRMHQAGAFCSSLPERIWSRNSKEAVPMQVVNGLA